MRARFVAVMRARVAGVPVPVLFVVGVLVLALIIHRRRVAASKATSAQDNDALDNATPIGAMARGGYPATDYAYPSTVGGDTTEAIDTTGAPEAGKVVSGVFTPGTSGVTVTGEPTGSTAAPSKLTPPKTSPARSHHPAGHQTRPRPHPKPVHKAAAPAKHSAVHQAVPKRTAPKVHTAPAHTKPKPPAAKPDPRKVVHPTSSRNKRRPNVPGARL